MQEYKKLRIEYNSVSNKKKLKDLLGDKCFNCDSNDNVQYHHVVPLALGGTNKVTNMVPLCYVCHQKAHGSRNIRKICSSAKTGRKRKEVPENYKEILDSYTKGEIGMNKCREFLNITGASKLSDKKFYKEYLSEKGIKKCRNNVDTLLQERLKGRIKSKTLAIIEYSDGEIVCYEGAI